MDRKTLLTFIAVYSFALANALYFGGAKEIKVDTVVDQPATYILDGNATHEVVAAMRSVDTEGHSAFGSAMRKQNIRENPPSISL